MSARSHRRWRADVNPGGHQQHGYHELHLADAFDRYLNKGLPSGKPRPSDVPVHDVDQKPRASQRFFPAKGVPSRFHPTIRLKGMKTKLIQILPLSRIKTLIRLMSRMRRPLIRLRIPLRRIRPSLIRLMSRMGVLYPTHQIHEQSQDVNPHETDETDKSVRDPLLRKVYLPLA